MKIRNCFVSNSSSSSFIIPLEKLPETIEETKELFFPGIDELTRAYGDDSEDTLKTHVVIGAILTHLSGKTPLTRDELILELSSGYLYLDEYGCPPQPEYDDYGNWEEYAKAKKEYCALIADDMLKEAGKRNLYCVECEDDTDMGSLLEHNGIFESIGSFRINKH